MKAKKSVSVALSGIISALSIVTMFLTAVLPVVSLSLCAVAGMFLAVIVIEFGYRHALSSYFVALVLSGLFVADKDSVFLFGLFFGLYPIVKSLMERIGEKVLQWTAKLAFFNGVMIVYYFLATLVLLLPADEFQIAGQSVPLLILLFGNVVFVFYDVAFSRLISFYRYRLQENLRKRLGL